MKSLLGSTGHWNTMTSPRRGARSPGRRTCVNGIFGPYSILFTNRKSPTSSVSHMDSDGIRNAWMTNARSRNVNTTAHAIASVYSRTTDLSAFCFAMVSFRRRSAAIHLEHREERLLRHLDRTDLLHAPLALFLLLEQLALASDVTAVALRQHVLPLRAECFARDDLAADRRLDRDLEHLSRDQLLELLAQRAAVRVRLLAVDDRRQRVDRLAVEQDVELDDVRLLVPVELIVERRVAARDRLQPVVEVEHDLPERQPV